ncbi:MAG: hypothetical protein WAP51_01365 [Candidatus Sungiibacteriota bacterium]
MKLFYSPKLLTGWRKGSLQRQWHKKYPNIFDADDLKLALSQRKHHFGEWYVARHFADRGYKVLVEKYIYPSHQRKFRTMKKRWPGVLDYLRHLRRKYHCQPPDLLIYRDNNFFFVEVKRDSDYEKKNQKRMFALLRKNLKKPIKICYVLRVES